VDTGTGSGGVILEKIKKLGMEPEEIDAVFITHLHWDHFGGLGSDGKANFPNAVVFISEREFDHFTRIAVNQRVLDALEPYGSNIITFEPCILGSTYRELVPGLTAIANYGHTPGHTVFLVENSGAKLVIAGDFLHVALVQFPNPDISATFDMDQDAAAASRRQILNYAARNRIPVGGIHIVYPGIGNVEADGNGFRFIPVVSATLNN
jgi:glyoxylase-like metal-dependent hydrolase (beta-lactamase superfamily II)